MLQKFYFNPSEKEISDLKSIVSYLNSEDLEIYLLGLSMFKSLEIWKKTENIYLPYGWGYPGKEKEQRTKECYNLRWYFRKSGFGNSEIYRLACVFLKRIINNEWFLVKL